MLFVHLSQTKRGKDDHDRGMLIQQTRSQSATNRFSGNDFLCVLKNVYTHSSVDKSTRHIGYIWNAYIVTTYYFRGLQK